MINLAQIHQQLGIKPTSLTAELEATQAQALARFTKETAEHLGKQEGKVLEGSISEAPRETSKTK